MAHKKNPQVTVPKWAFDELNKAAEIVGLSSSSQVVAMLTRQCLPIWLQQQKEIYSNLQQSTADTLALAVGSTADPLPVPPAEGNLQQSTADNSKGTTSTANPDFLQALKDS